jgi:hypothetical protein
MMMDLVYVTATNSHSIYKGNQLVPTGKVNVGGSLESIVVENVLFSIIPFETGKVIDYFYANSTAILVTSNSLRGDLEIGDIVKYPFDLPNWTMPNTLDNNWYKSASITSTPTHSTIALDNSNSPAVKFIETIAEDEDGMAHYQVFAQEMVSNAGAYDGDNGEFTQLANGTLTDDNATTVKTICASIPLNKYIGA